VNKIGKKSFKIKTEDSKKTGQAKHEPYRIPWKNRWNWNEKW